MHAANESYAKIDVSKKRKNCLETKEDDIFRRNAREMKEIGNTRPKIRKRNREREK